MALMSPGLPAHRNRPNVALRLCFAESSAPSSIPAKAAGKCLSLIHW